MQVKKINNSIEIILILIYNSVMSKNYLQLCDKLILIYHFLHKGLVCFDKKI